MKRHGISPIRAVLTLSSLPICGCNKAPTKRISIDSLSARQSTPDSTSGYAPVNGLKIYYEVHGKGAPLVLIHGGGSTIQTTFGRVLHSFAKDRKIIAVELQAHGHTADIDRPETFEQDADDVAALLQYLKIERADFFGFSNGGNTALQIAIRHPEIARRIVVGSAFYKRDGLYPQFWNGMKNASLKDMPAQLQDAYKKTSPDPTGLVKMFNRDRNRMLDFKDWKDSDLKSIKSPVLIIVSDKDVVRPEHAVEMYRLMPQARLSILPDGHGAYIGEVTTGREHSKLPELSVAMIEEFLDNP